MIPIWVISLYHVDRCVRDHFHSTCPVPRNIEDHPRLAPLVLLVPVRLAASSPYLIR